LRKINKQTLVVGLFLFVGALASFCREVLFGYFYGLSQVLDAYRVAISLPQTVGMILHPVFVATLIPVLQKIRIENPDQEKIFLRKFFRQLFIGGSIISLTLCLFSSQWISILAPGFSADLKNYSASQLSYFSWYFLFLVLVGGYKAMFDSHEIFLPGASINIFLHGSVVFSLSILAFFGFVKRFPSGSLIISTLISGIILFVIQFSIAFPLKFKQKTHKPLFITDVTQLEYKIPWLGIGVFFLYHAMGQAVRFIDRGIGSQFGENVISIVEYSFNIISFPSFLLITSVITVFYPTFTKMYALGDVEGARRQLLRLSSLMFLISSVLCVFIWLFGFEIIRIVFAHGAFTSDASIRVYDFLSYQLYGVPFMVTGLLFAQVLVAYGKYRLLLILGVWKLIIKFVSAIILIKFMGWLGLALSFSITAIIGALLSIFYVFKVQSGKSCLS